MVSLLSSNSHNASSSSHHNSSTSHSHGSRPPQQAAHRINPPYPHNRHSSTTQQLTKHRHPNHLLSLSHHSTSHLQPRHLTTLLPRSDQHLLLRLSLHGLSHPQYQCINPNPPMLCRHRCHHQHSMVPKDSLQCRFSIQEVQSLLGLHMLAPV